MANALTIPEFQPHPLLVGGHRQTIAGVYWPLPKDPYSAVRHLVRLSDGDQIVLHDDQPPTWRVGDRCVLLIHGLSGSYASPYLIRIARKLGERGFRTFRMDMRGCGAGYHLAEGPGHAGRSGDVAAALRMIESLCPSSAVTAAGFSLGGNLVLKLVGELGSDSCGGLDSAFAVAPPVDLRECSKNIGKGTNRIYDRVFVRSMMRQLRTKQSAVPKLAAFPLHHTPGTLFEFDNRVTAPLSGFSGADEYYARCSSAPLLKNVRVPTVIITASDDPLIPVSMFHRFELSSEIQFYCSSRGGHVGFIGRQTDEPDRFWMDWRVVDWVEQMAKQTPELLAAR